MIGDRLRELRKAKGMTQEHLAKWLNSAKSTISQYENNVNEPDIETIIKLANCFSVSVDYLLGNDSCYDNPNTAPPPGNDLLRERLTEDEADYLTESLAMYRKWKEKRESAETDKKDKE